MQKKIMQDIVPNNKRSIRHVPLGNGKGSTTDAHASDAHHNEEPDNPEQRPIRKKTLPPQPRSLRAEGKSQRVWVWCIGILILLVLIGIGVSFGFGGAQLLVSPKQEEVRIDGVFEAYASAAAAELPFEVVTVTKTLSQDVTATGEEQVDTKASGEIVVFNDFDESDQRLIANTRFTSTEGFVYRIDEAVTVPGRYKDENGESVPGSIEITIYADAVGEAYNVDRTDFTIPGFQESNDPRFFKFFARSKTPMEGGFSGIQKTLDKELEAQTRDSLRSQLEAQLAGEVVESIGEDTILFSDFVLYSFVSEPPQTTTDESVAEVTEVGTGYALVFSKDEVARHIARNTVAVYSGEDVTFTYFEDIEAALVGKDTLTPGALETMMLSLSGSGTITWDYDAEQLKADLSGKDKRDVDMVLSGYPSIERAEINLRPFWRGAFPKEAENIKIIEEVTQ